jgi:CMP/dCMP kinase
MMPGRTPVIAIDGTSASGKGTLTRRLGRHLGYATMDTGSLYRLVALKVLEAGKDETDPAFVVREAVALARTYRADQSNNPAIRSAEVSQMTSKISTIPDVRQEILALQRNFAAYPTELEGKAMARGAILDGRDIGTVVCPDADVKFFVTAQTEIRAKRRHKELQSTGFPVTYEAVLADMLERDARDSGRKTAPMKPAADAMILDTSDMTVDQVFGAALAHIQARLGV